jgi:serine/threonine protein kinase
MTSILDSLRNVFRYDLVSTVPIKSGGCGHIWAAQDKLFGRKVAIKTVSELLFWDYPEQARRSFVKEAIAGARLSEKSRHIVKVFDFGVTGDVPFFVMEWIEPDSDGGIDVSNSMGAISLAKAKAIFFQICEAVEVAHNNGIIHSDIAPWNIVRESNLGIYKLTDFGLLKIVEESLVSKGSGTLLQGGRRQFQPPEVLRDISKISYGSDLYALAISFRALLEGDEFLRTGATSTPAVVRVRHEQRDAPDQVRQLLARFVESHSEGDRISDFIPYLQQIPN